MELWKTAEMLMKKTGFRPAAIGQRDEAEHLTYTMEQYVQNLYDADYAANIYERYELPCVDAIDAETARQYDADAAVMLAVTITKMQHTPS